MHRLAFVYLLLILSFTALAGGKLLKPSEYNYEYRFHYGFIWPHHESIRYLQKAHIPAFDLRISKTMVNSGWAQLYRFPELGVGYYHNNMQWPDVLGKVNAGYGFIRVPVIRKPAIQINYSFAFGLAFISDYFDIEENYFNIAIGSFTNVYLNFGFDIRKKIRDNLLLFAGADLSHVSNGAIKKPNLGLNLPAIHVGLTYLPDPVSPSQYRLNSHAGQGKTFDVLVTGSVGWKEEYPPGGDLFYTSSAWIDAGYTITKRKRLGIGVDFFYDGSISQRMERKNTGTEIKRHNRRQGAHLSYDLIFGKVFFTIQAGYYFLVKWNDNTSMYNRFGLRYHHNDLIFNVSLKTHLGRADFIEWGIGYVLFKQKK